MSEHLHRSARVRGAATGLALLALAATSTSPVGAQSVEESRANVARLERAVADAQLAVDRADSISRVSLPRDTVRESGFVILTTRDLEGVAREAAVLAEPELRATLGDMYASVAARPFVLRVAAARLWMQVGDSPPKGNSVELAGLGQDGLPIEPWAREDRSAERIARNMVRMVMRGVHDRMPADLRTWLGVPPSTLPVNANAFDGTYIEMVTQPSQSVRSCFAGNSAHCADALEVRRIEDPMTTWYSPAERRLLVQRIGESFRRDARKDTRFNLCVEKGVERVCDELLRSRLSEQSASKGVAPLPAPFGSQARSSVLHVALRIGGSGAFRRLVEAAEAPTIEARLAAAAGVSPDSLLSAWRSSVIASRPSQVTLTARIAWTALIWGVFASALALRSSRWR